MACFVPAQHYVIDASIQQQFFFKIAIDCAVRQQGQRRNLGPFDARQKKVLSITRNRGHKDQDFGEHHENDREDQEPP